MPQTSLVFQSTSRPINVQYVNLEILYYIRVRNARIINLPITQSPNLPIKSKEIISQSIKSANRPIGLSTNLPICQSAGRQINQFT